MNICTRILEGTKVSDALWVLMTSEDQIRLFKEWILSVRPTSHTDFARISYSGTTAFTWFDAKWDDYQGIIDRIDTPDMSNFCHEYCTFEDWMASAYPCCDEDAVCDCDDLL